MQEKVCSKIHPFIPGIQLLGVCIYVWYQSQLYKLIIILGYTSTGLISYAYGLSMALNTQ